MINEINLRRIKYGVGDFI